MKLTNKTRETKTAESSLDRTSKGSTGSLAKATGREKRFLCLPRPDLDRTRETGRPVPKPVEPVGHSLDRLSLLAPKTYLFLFLSFPILRQGL
ncbi:hypothetical protein AAG906_019538 [Vitis piasezkii]